MDHCEKIRIQWHVYQMEINILSSVPKLICKLHIRLQIGWSCNDTKTSISEWGSQLASQVINVILLYL